MVPAPRALWRELYRTWLRRRIPAASEVTLDQRRIFILPTGYGLVYLAVIAALFLGGINYENNPMLGMSFFLAGLFVVAILHTFRNLAGVCLLAGDMRPGFAQARGALEIRLRARPRRRHVSLWLSWKGSLTREVTVEPGEERSVWLDVVLPRRGRIRPPRLRVETRFPLGLFRAWSLVDLDQHCLAWPAPLESAWCPAAGGEDDEGAEGPLAGSDDYEGLRAYAPGDSLRAIDWKSLARERGLNTKLFVDPAEGRCWLEWDRLAGEDVELRLAHLCWWVLELERAGAPWGLRLPDGTLAPGNGPDHQQRALRMLALYGEAD